MQEIINLAKDFGAPVLIAVLIIFRLERRLERLEDAMRGVMNTMRDLILVIADGERAREWVLKRYKER